MTGVVKRKVIMQSCFAMEIQGLVRHLSGNRPGDYSERWRKSVLTSYDVSSLVVDRLCYQAREKNTAVTYFYFDFAVRKEQSAASILGVLLKQIIGEMEMIPEDISRAFREEGMGVGGPGPRLPDMVKMLQAVTSSLRLYICIDALDEYAAVHRANLLDSLKQILEKSPHTRVFITGRPHIRAEIEKHLARQVITAPIIPRKNDIIEYLRLKLDKDETPDAMDESLARDILEKIPENMSEMYVGPMIMGISPMLSANRYQSRFLLASLVIDAILHESTSYRRRERLRKMTRGLELEDVYGAAIERIKAQDGDKSRLGMVALMWVSHAERQLLADELCHALAVELGSAGFDASNVPSISTLVSCCQGLVTLDKKTSTLRLIHFTLQEYLSGHPDIFGRPHSAIAEICLTYLNSKQVKALSTAPSPEVQNAPFLEYCSIYWGVHAKRELSDCGRSLAVELLKEHYCQIPTKLLLGQLKDVCLDYLKTFYPFSGLHCASFFGIVEVVSTLIEMGCYDINEGDFLGFTPLAWAAHNGHEGVVKLLLERKEVNPDKPDKYGQTPLSYAAGGGYEGVVKILLAREEVSSNKPDHSGQTPLSEAASNGHEGVVRLLLERGDVNPGEPDRHGRTPLLYAAQYGHEGVVKMLLGREEVNPDITGSYGRTPLSFAAGGGYERVVRILLGREEVNPDKPDYDMRTPLSHAASNGHEAVVKLLLGQEQVNPDIPGGYGGTPLSFAAWFGHERVVKLLLGRENVSPDKPDINGRTPLSLAAWFGHEAVMKILLGREEVNPERPDNEGRTPLWYAAWHGHEGAVEILLKRKEVNPDTPDNHGLTPLSYAACAGRESVVRVLLGREEVNPEKPDYSGQTPLSFAAWFGHERVVEMLLEREDVDPNKPDSSGLTPLSYAAWDGREGVVKILLGREEVNPEQPSNSGQTPLSFAASHGHEGVVKILLGRADVNPDKPDNKGRTPLSFAAEGRHEGVVKILLGREEVNPGKPDNDGQTPLWYAKSRYWGKVKSVVALLESHKTVSPSTT